MKILSTDELIELTGFKQKQKIINHLEKNRRDLSKQGFNYYGVINNLGYPVVTYSENQKKEKSIYNTWYPSV